MQRRVTDQEEVEWQFEVADLGPVRDWLEERSSVCGMAVVSGAPRDLIDTYYDTEDWRFYSAGYALRVRREGENAEATMKTLTPAEGAIRRRREISEPLEGDDVGALKRARGPVGERLRILAGARNLRPLFETRTRRRTFELRSGAKFAVGEISLDESEIFGKTSVLLSRVEVEVDPDAALDTVLRELVGEMQATLGLRPAELSKFEEGLSAAKPSLPGAVEVVEPSGEDGE